jgi:2-hydroxy-3-keto-5-methylthiopentenyl-1-phosphate phosphatase
MSKILFQSKCVDDILQKFKKDGVDDFYIITNFISLITPCSDRCSGILRKNKNLSHNFHNKIIALFNSLNNFKNTDQQKKLCNEVNILLESEKLNVDSIKECVKHSYIIFRKDVLQIFKICEDNNIPIIIFSTGIKNIIQEIFIQKVGNTYDNIHIISNEFIINKNKTIVGFKDDMIYSLNKNEHIIENNLLINNICRHRKNALLVGSSNEAANMINYFENTILKVGLLNGNDMLYLNFCKLYNIVINDAETLDDILDIIGKIFIY